GRAGQRAVGCHERSGSRAQRAACRTDTWRGPADLAAAPAAGQELEVRWRSQRQPVREMMEGPMTRVWSRLVLLAAVGNAAVPARGSAQPAPAPAPANNQNWATAAKYTEAGLAAAKNGDYDTAIDFYEKAFELVPHPTLIFNIAEAHRLAGRTDEAL